MADRGSANVSFSVVGTWEWDLETGAVTWSDGFYRLFGLEPGSIPATHDNLIAMVHPDDRPGLDAGIYVAERDRVPNMSFRVIRPDGSLRWTAGIAERFPGEGGSPGWAAGVLIDVTDLRESQIELAAEKARYEALANVNSLGVWRANPEGDFLKIDFWCRFTGQRQEETHRLGWLATVHPDDVGGVEENWRDALRIGSATQFSYRARHHSGEYRWILTRVAPVRGEDGSIVEWVGSDEDVNDHREAQESLRVNEERLRIAVEAAGMVTWEYDHRTGHVTRSSNAMKVVGFETGHVDDYLARVDPEDRRRIREAILRTIRAGEPYALEYRYPGADGRTRWVRASGRLMRSLRGDPDRIIGITFDITAEKDAEERLAEASRRLGELGARQRALESVAGFIVQTVAPDGKSLDDMPAWREFTGKDPEKVQGLGWVNAVHPADREAFREMMQRVMDTRSRQVIEHRIRDTSGAYQVFRTRIAPVIGENGVVREWIMACQKLVPQTSWPDAGLPAPDIGPPPASIAPWQVRAARAILGWSASNLAEASGVSLSSVRRIEDAQSNDPRMLLAVRSTLEHAGIEFPSTPDGRESVRPAKGDPEIR